MLMLYLKIKPIPHFALEEIMCPCGCGLIILQREVLIAMYHVRMRFGEPIIAESWTRCPAHNSEVGGVDESFHLFGKAVDPRPQYGGITQEFVGICREYFPKVIVKPTCLHVDIRGDRSL